MVTVISIKRDTVAASNGTNHSKRNWHKLDRPQFLSEMEALLRNLSPLKPHTEIKCLDTQLLAAITTAISNSSLIGSRAFKHKAWWEPHYHEPAT